MMARSEFPARLTDCRSCPVVGDNIDALLLARHTAKKIRNGGGRLKGPSKRTAEQDKAFFAALTALLHEVCR